jgi:hypothetical protein
MSLRRLLIAFLVAPLATPLLFAAVGVVSNRRGPFDDEIAMYRSFALLAYASAAVLGAPVVLAFTRCDVRSVVAYLTGGALTGALTLALWMRWLGAPTSTRTVWLFLVAGAITGLVFRQIAGVGTASKAGAPASKAAN